MRRAEYPQLENALTGFETMKTPLNPYGLSHQAPPGLSWHHQTIFPGESFQEIGFMQLTPSAQHGAGGIFPAHYHLQRWNGRWVGGYYQWERFLDSCMDQAVSSGERA